MRRSIIAALATALLAAGPATAQERETVVLEDGTFRLDRWSPYYEREDVDLVIGDGAIALVRGFVFPGEIHVTSGGSLTVDGASNVHTLRVSGTGRAVTEARLQVLRLLAHGEGRIDGPHLDIQLPPIPKEEEEWTAEEWDAWYAQRLGAPHYLLASGDARITFDELLGDPITVQTRIEDRAEVTIRGHASWLGLDLRDDARLTGGSLWATGEATDRARLDITEDASWGSIDLRDDASARLVGSGGPSTGFSIRLHDRANAQIERAKAGMYQHWGSGLLEVVDTVAPAELGGQRELRIWMRSADARVSLRNFGHQHSLNLPVCGMPCNPWFVIFGEGEYVRAEDSVFHMEIDRTRFVELEDSVGLSVYPVRTGGGGYKDPVRGECIRSVASATNVGFEGHCARLRVSVLGSDGAMLPGATVTLLDGVSGEPSPAYDAGSGEVDARRTTDAAGVATFDLARRAHPLKVRVQGPGIDHTTDVFVVATDAHDLTVRLPR